MGWKSRGEPVNRSFDQPCSSALAQKNYLFRQTVLAFTPCSLARCSPSTRYSDETETKNDELCIGKSESGNRWQAPRLRIATGVGCRTGVRQMAKEARGRPGAVSTLRRPMRRVTKPSSEQRGHVRNRYPPLRNLFDPQKARGCHCLDNTLCERF